MLVTPQILSSIIFILGIGLSHLEILSYVSPTINDIIITFQIATLTNPCPVRRLYRVYRVYRVYKVSRVKMKVCSSSSSN